MVIWERRLERTGRPSLIVVGVGALDRMSTEAAQAHASGSRFYLVTDHNLATAWLGEIVDRLRSVGCHHEYLSLPPGEASKSVSGLQSCWDWLAERGCRRNDVVIALGGGVVGDLAGLAAATYQRGVDLWQIPTSLLAQVDSSVGGKTAIDLSAGKNLVGAFYQPSLVLVDPRTLDTLPEPEYINGLGEVVKYGLLDDGLLSYLEANSARVRRRDRDVLARLIQTCIAYKAAVVEEDEFDRGRRAVLNLGHTVGHALEVTLGYGAIAHGQAVGLGLLVALAVSERLLGLDAEVSARVRRLLGDWGLATGVLLPPADDLLAAARKDKKVGTGGSNFVGVRAPGSPVWGLDVSYDLLRDTLEVIRV